MAVHDFAVRGGLVPRIMAKTRGFPLALQLSFFEVSALSFRLVGSAPERPCDDVCGFNALLSESDGDAADFLD